MGLIQPDVNMLLILCEEKNKKHHFDPNISIPGVKIDVNIVNILFFTPTFPFQAQFMIIKQGN